MDAQLKAKAWKTFISKLPWKGILTVACVLLTMPLAYDLLHPQPGLLSKYLPHAKSTFFTHP